jgi:uncharacterized membrane protein
MEPHAAIQSIEWIALSLEMLGVAVIAFVFGHAIVRALLHFGQKRENAYELLRIYVGQGLLLGLEFLVAADIVRTVSIEPTIEGIGVLGMLIIVRFFLGSSITLETEGRWPWQPTKKKTE